MYVIVFYSCLFFSITITNMTDGLNDIGVVGELYYGVGYDRLLGPNVFA